MLRKLATICLGLSLALGLGSCGDTASDPEFFPLNKGYAWTYRVLRDDKTGHHRETLNVSNTGKDKLGVIRTTSYGTDYHIAQDSSGIFRSGKRTLSQSDPVKDDPVRYILKAPISEGTTWENWSQVYMLTFHMPDGSGTRSLFYEKPFLMTYSIEEVGVSVDVPAGRFEDCIKVIGTATLTLFTDPQNGFQDIPVTTTEWYDRKVGLVKLERVEDVHSEFYSGGRYTIELEDFSR